MTSSQKVALVRMAVPGWGLHSALAAVGLSRATWYYHQQRRAYTERYRHLRRPLELIARAQPEYGYRRTAVELRESCGLVINHKVVQRLHQLWDLPLLRGARRPRMSGTQQAIVTAGHAANLITDKTRIQPFAVLYADFSEIRYARAQQRAQVITLIDHATKLVVGWALGARKTAQVALAAWERAKQWLHTWGADLQGMIVHHDQDAVFTGYHWTAKLLLDNGVRLSYSLHGAKGNSEVEAFFSRFTTENRSLFQDCQTLAELTTVIGARIEYFNRERRHSRLGYRAPLTYAMSAASSCRGIAYPPRTSGRVIAAMRVGDTQWRHQPVLKGPRA